MIGKTMRMLIASAGLVGLLGCDQSTETQKKNFLADVVPVTQNELPRMKREFAYKFTCFRKECEADSGLNVTYQNSHEYNQCMDDKIKEHLSTAEKVVAYVAIPDVFCKEVTPASDGHGKGELVKYNLNNPGNSNYFKLQMLKAAKELALGMDPRVNFEKEVEAKLYQVAVDASERNDNRIVAFYLNEARDFARETGVTVDEKQYGTQIVDAFYQEAVDDAKADSEYLVRVNLQHAREFAKETGVTVDEKQYGTQIVDAFYQKAVDYAKTNSEYLVRVNLQHAREFAKETGVTVDEKQYGTQIVNAFYEKAVHHAKANSEYSVRVNLQHARDFARETGVTVDEKQYSALETKLN